MLILILICTGYVSFSFIDKLDSNHLLRCSVPYEFCSIVQKRLKAPAATRAGCQLVTIIYTRSMQKKGSSECRTCRQLEMSPCNIARVWLEWPIHTTHAWLTIIYVHATRGTNTSADDSSLAGKQMDGPDHANKVTRCWRASILQHACIFIKPDELLALLSLTNNYIYI
jgi:hypothetical protein